MTTRKLGSVYGLFAVILAVFLAMLGTGLVVAHFAAQTPGEKRLDPPPGSVKPPSNSSEVPPPTTQTADPGIGTEANPQVTPGQRLRLSPFHLDDVLRTSSTEAG